MNFLLTIPPLIKVLTIFAFILILNRFRCNLGAAILMGACLLALWFGLGIKQTGLLVVSSFLSSQTLILLAIVGLILVLSRVMEECGQTERIVSSFSAILRSPRRSLAAMPALIGLLPMPGGAVFSAPMVDTVAGSSSLVPSQKGVINYWFRHIWEYWWPLYPGVILAVSLTGIELYRFIGVQLPLTFAALLGGYLFIFLPMRRINLAKISFPVYREWKIFFREVLPILLTVVLVILFGLATWALRSWTGREPGLPKNISIILGLLVSLTWVITSHRVGGKIIKGAALNKMVYSMLFLIIGIMAFGGILQHSGAIVGIKENLIELNIPLPVMVAILPLVSGMVTGVTIGFVGPSFPVLVELVRTSEAAGGVLPYAVLAYGFGFMGVMLSPVHLCFILTKDFFRTDIIKIYRRLLLPCLTVLIFVILMFLLLK